MIQHGPVPASMTLSKINVECERSTLLSNSEMRSEADSGFIRAISCVSRVGLLVPAPAPSETDWYAIVSGRPAFRAGLRSLGGMELVEFRMTVYAAIWGGNGNVSAPIPHKLKGLFDG